MKTLLLSYHIHHKSIRTIQQSDHRIIIIIIGTIGRKKNNTAIQKGIAFIPSVVRAF